MSENELFSDAQGDFDRYNPLRADAVRLEARTRRGKRCVLIDNTGRNLPLGELRAILDGLIEHDHFGFKSFSAAGGDAIDLNRRESSHVQIGDRLYRLIVYRLEARLENF
ncbi:MAG: hypothetical protein ACREUA_01590 [Burkholderiales bacterium]